MNCQVTGFTSMIPYAVPICNPEQWQWGARPVSGWKPQDDRNLVVKSDPLPLSASD